MSRLVKTTTGLTGLPVAHDAKLSLQILYKKLLDVLTNMPETSFYRQKTQIIIQDRLRVVETVARLDEIEKNIDGGQAEELVIQAERELQLARKMLVWKPWDGPAQEAPPNQWKWPI